MRFVEELPFETFRRFLVQRQFIGTEGVPQRPEACLSLRSGDAGLEASDKSEERRLVVVEVITGRHPWHGDLHHAHGDERAGLVTSDSRVEIFWRDTENAEGVAVDENGLADDIARCSKARLPVTVAQDHDGV